MMEESVMVEHAMTMLRREVGELHAIPASDLELEKAPFASGGSSAVFRYGSRTDGLTD
jgi:hypothetical protein